MQALKSRKIEVATIPGITSFTATASCCSNEPLPLHLSFYLTDSVILKEEILQHRHHLYFKTTKNKEEISFDKLEKIISSIGISNDVQFIQSNRF